MALKKFWVKAAIINYGFKNFLSESHIVTLKSLEHISLSISSRVALFWA